MTASPPDTLRALRDLLADQPPLAALCDRLSAPACAEPRVSVLRLVGAGRLPPGSRPRTGVHAPHAQLFDALCPPEYRAAARASVDLLEETSFLFCTDLRSHGLSTADRVPPRQGSPHSLLLGSLQRRLQLGQTMLLTRAGRQIEVLPTLPPSIVCGTELPLDDPTVRFCIARAAASTRPEQLLWTALPTETSRAAYDAIGWAFGTPPGSPALAHAAAFGKKYHLLSARTQRTLRRRLEEGALPSFEVVHRFGVVALHRAALVATGDLGAALLVLAAEDAALAGLQPRTVEGLAHLLRRSALAQDLLRFAVSDAYPDLRAGAPSPSRSPSGRLAGYVRAERRPVTEPMRPKSRLR